MKIRFIHCALSAGILVAFFMCPATASAEKMVVVDAKGNLLNIDSAKVKALAKEKMRVTKIKKRVIEEQLPAEEMVKLLFESIIEPNKEQFEQNVKNSNKFKSMAKQAASRNQKETAKKYMKVARLFYEYSLRNKAIVMAYSNGSSAQIRVASEEILKIEKQIKAISKKEVPRKWLTMEEVRSVSIMTEKQYKKMQKAKMEEQEKEAKNKATESR